MLLLYEWNSNEFVTIIIIIIIAILLVFESLQIMFYERKKKLFEIPLIFVKTIF